MSCKNSLLRLALHMSKLNFVKEALSNWILLAAAMVAILAYFGVEPIKQARYLQNQTQNNTVNSSTDIYIDTTIASEPPNVGKKPYRLSTGGDQPKKSYRDESVAPLSSNTVVVLPILINQFSDGKRRSEENYQFVRNILEQLARESGARLVDRQSLDDIVQELQFQRTTLVNERSRISIGKMLGAKLLMQCIVEDARMEESSFKGYGTTFKTKTVRAVVNVKMIDIRTGETLFSKRLEGESDIALESQYGNNNTEVTAQKAIENAVKKLSSNAQFRLILKGSPA